MMQWTLFLVVCVTGARTQPASCVNDSQCFSGYYCVSDLKACRECLRCEDLNREPPRSAVSCIRSVIECGPCKKGLVDDRGGELGDSCTEPSSEGEDMPVYVWAVIACLILIFAFIAFGAFIFMRRTDTFKILACTSVQTPVLNGVPPSAPQPPPPYNYNAQYTPVRPSSPHDQPTANTGDPSLPLVKRAPSCGGYGDTRESAGSQAAQVFNNPAYVRNAQPPPSYDSAFSDESDHEAPFVPQDEDTMPSPWTPNTTGNNNDTNGNDSAMAVSVAGEPESSTAAVALRRPSPSDPMAPPTKMICVREDSNNNRNPGSSGGTRSEPSPAAAAPSVVINVLNVNSVHQLNDVSL